MGFLVIFFGGKDDGSSDAFICAAHPMGATSVSWAPSVLPGSLTKPNLNPAHPPLPGQEKQKRFVTGGCDSKVKIWGWRFVVSTMLEFAYVQSLTLE